MIIENAFTIVAPRTRVFDAMLDLERLVPCLPGARLDGVINGGATATGQVRLPMGRTSISYRGTLRVSEADREGGAIILSVDAHEVRGAGRVTATVDVRLSEHEGATSASLRGTSHITGRAAAVAPDVMQRAATSMLRRFGAALALVVADTGRRAPRRRTPGNEGLEAAIRALDDLEPPPAGNVRGAVMVMTDGPLAMPARTSAVLSACRGVRDRPWVFAAVVAGIIAVAVVLRRRRY